MFGKEILINLRTDSQYYMEKNYTVDTTTNNRIEQLRNLGRDLAQKIIEANDGQTQFYITECWIADTFQREVLPMLRRYEIERIESFALMNIPKSVRDKLYSRMLKNFPQVYD